MVFTSLPIYLDPPNWNQRPNQQPTPPPITTNPQPPGPNTDTASNPVRPGSMAERARMAKIPQPEPALKCPRCDSTNTKFCYFNNYSLSQPRHFCKSCRRYWTRGGSLRNVPVGGGSRRNAKRPTSTTASSKSSSSKNSMHSPVQGPPPQLQLPYLGDHYGSLLGLNGDLGGPGLGLDQWRIQQIHQQYPFLGGMESSSAPDAALHGIYPSFDGEGDLGFGLAKPPGTSGIITQMAAVKMEDSRNRLQYLGGGGWPGDLAGFSSPSLGNIL